MTQNNDINEPSSGAWYREVWVWIVITPLIASVILSSIMVTVAVGGADDVVTDNYYKEGRLLAQEHTSEEYARSLGLTAELAVDNISGEVTLNLNQRVEVDRVMLLISHPAKAALDQTLELQKTSSRRYRADMAQAIEGRWYLRLSASRDGESLWRLHGDLDLAQSTVAALE